ncbi:hypothetical protein EJB05_12620, partial [Eragrostis curvula]
MGAQTSENILQRMTQRRHPFGASSPPRRRNTSGGRATQQQSSSPSPLRSFSKRYEGGSGAAEAPTLPLPVLERRPPLPPPPRARPWRRPQLRERCARRQPLSPSPAARLTPARRLRVDVDRAHRPRGARHPRRGAAGRSSRSGACRRRSPKQQQLPGRTRVVVSLRVLRRLAFSPATAGSSPALPTAVDNLDGLLKKQLREDQTMEALPNIVESIMAVSVVMLDHIADTNAKPDYQTCLAVKGKQSTAAPVTESDESVRHEIMVRKGPWEPEEDSILSAYVKEHGTGCWRKVAERSGLHRSGKSCRLRWINYLRPGIKRGNFTDVEEMTVIKLHNELGNSRPLRWDFAVTADNTFDFLYVHPHPPPQQVRRQYIQVECCTSVRRSRTSGYRFNESSIG